MRKLLLPAMLLAVFLNACAQPAEPMPTPSPTPSPTPAVTAAPSQTSSPTTEPSQAPEELWGFPIDDTHDAFEVDTKGKLGTVLVTVEIENIDAEEYQFSVWTKDDLQTPLQTMTAESCGVFRWNDVVDVNFDGYMDFGYMYAMGNQPTYWHYWVWDEAKGQFVQEPEFDQISMPGFDPETGIISGYARNGFAGLAGVATFHKWVDGQLTCIRRVETYPYGGMDNLENLYVTVTVEEPVGGTLTTIFQENFSEGEALSEAQKWWNLDYHG